MSRFSHAAALLLTAALAATLPASADAQNFNAGQGFTTGKSKGDRMVGLRVLRVAPDEQGDIRTVSPDADTGSDVRLNSDTALEANFSYFLTNNVAVSASGALTRHKLTADTPTGGQGMGDLRQLSTTVTAQYHLQPQDKFSPYIGAGLNYTTTYRTDNENNFSNLQMDPGFGVAAQAGADYFLTNQVYLNMDVKKVWLDSKMKAVSPTGSALRSNVDIDPWVLGVGAGYKF